METIPLFTLLSFLFFTGLVGLLTWRIVRKSEHESNEGYFLAGRSLTAGVIAGSLLLTNLSTEQLVGLNGTAFNDGLAVMAWEVVAGLSLVVMALFFLPRYLRRGIATIPQFLANRFDRTTQAITNVIFIFAYMAILLPIILYSGAMGLKEILNVSALTGIQSDAGVLWLTVWVIGILGSIYAIFGGLKSVAVSDTLNGFGLLVGGLLIVYFGLQAVNDQGVFAALDELAARNPEKFNSLGGEDSSVPWHTLFTGVLLLNLFYWTTNQQIIQRTFAAQTLAEGQKGVLLAAMFKVLAPIMFVLPGIIAFHLYGGDGDSGIKADEAYGTLVRDVLPPALSGFFAAALVGAILSSFNSALNATATLFSLGVYRQFIQPLADDRQTVRAGRIFGTVIAVAAMSVAPLLAGQDSLFDYLQKMNGLYFIPIFSVVLVGMLSRRVPAAAANVALLIGVAAIALGYFQPTLAGQLEALALHEFHFLGIVFAALVAMMLLWGRVAPRPPVAARRPVAPRDPARREPEQPEAATAAPAPSANPYASPTTVSDSAASQDAPAEEDEDRAPIDMTPWPLAPLAGGLLVVVVLAIYIYFAF